MSLPALMNQRCWLIVRTESGTEDDYGNDIPSEAVVETTCYIEQKRREENESVGEVSEADWLGMFPAGTELSTADAVSVDVLGEFELVGAPWPVRNPRTQAESHVEVTLRRVAGSEDGS